MGAFEYLSVLISIVLGLGITNLLQGFARWVERRDGYTFQDPSIVWAAFLVLAHVQTWWSMFTLRAWSTWNFLQFALVLAQPVVLYLLTAIVFPSASARHQDLAANFEHQRRWFFGLLLVLLAVSLGREVARTGGLPGAVNLAFHVAWAAAASLGFAFAAPRFQRALAYVGLTSLITYIVVLFSEL